MRWFARIALGAGACCAAAWSSCARTPAHGVVPAAEFATWARALAEGADVTLAARAAVDPAAPGTAPRELGRVRTLGRLGADAEQWLARNITSSIASMEAELREIDERGLADGEALVRQAFLVSVIEKARARLEILRRRDYWTVAQGDAQRVSRMPDGVLLWTQPVLEGAELRDVVYPIVLADFPAVAAAIDYLDGVRRAHARRTVEDFNRLPLAERRGLVALRSRIAELGQTERELVERWFPAGVSLTADAVMRGR